jgi:hypothetical protein
MICFDHCCFFFFYFKTDILQLDVTWLYDSFVGNGSNISTEDLLKIDGVTSEVEQNQDALTAAAVSSTKLYKASEAAHANISWEKLQQMRLASFSPNSTISVL